MTNHPNSFFNTRVIETGLSDFHKLTVTVLKTSYKKQPPTVISYRDYKNYSPSLFRAEFDNFIYFYGIYSISNDEFVNIYIHILNTHAPIKPKYIRTNENPFISKKLRQAIMLKSKLRNRYNKLRTEEAIIMYKRQRNTYTSLLRKCKKAYFNSIRPSDVADNKKFWKVIRPFFSDSNTTRERIALNENDVICDSDDKVATIFNSFFSNAVPNLHIQYDSIISHSLDEPDPILNATKKYSEHPSIKKIREHINKNESFSFSHTRIEDIICEITSLDVSKATPNDSIPPKLIKENLDLFAQKLFVDFNVAIDTGLFPNNMKLADVSPVFQKGDRLDKANYRPVSILSSLSKIFGKLLFNQINNYMDPKLSIYQTGFRKNHSSQNCLLVMLEKLRKCLDSKGSTGILLTDLSKAFDCF